MPPSLPFWKHADDGRRGRGRGGGVGLYRLFLFLPIFGWCFGIWAALLTSFLLLKETWQEVCKKWKCGKLLVVGVKTYFLLLHLLFGSRAKIGFFRFLFSVFCGKPRVASFSKVATAVHKSLHKVAPLLWNLEHTKADFPYKFLFSPTNLYLYKSQKRGGWAHWTGTSRFFSLSIHEKRRRAFYCWM